MCDLTKIWNRSIFGKIKNREGGVWIEGQSLRDMNNEERTVFRRKYIGFVFQQYNLVPILNIY